MDMMPSPRYTHSSSGARRRAAAACHACHARKVRCSISQTGTPCTNCSLDNATCQVRPRQPHLTARTRRGRSSRAPSNVDEDGPRLEGSVYRPFTGHFSHHVERADSLTTDTPAEAAGSPVYGDLHGVALVADVCEPERPGKSGHFVVAALGSTDTDPETLDYLRQRGCFDLPTLEVQQSLVQAYFHYVHPFFPIVHISSFLTTLESPDRHGMSLHLLWSVFLAAANFADSKTVHSAGFESRKAMKRAMFSRAKALYDADYERSKIVLIQAVLLMGFWYADTEDRLGPWHWNGIAISLCQTAGLHRRPDASLGDARHGPSMNQTLWRHLWWSCFFRETWLSVGMGRPMRVDLAHSDTPRPDADTSEGLCCGLSESQRQEYIPSSSGDLFLLWDELLSVTSVLSRVLAVQHLAQRTLSSPSVLHDLERELRGYHGHLERFRAGVTDPILTLHMYHFELFFESTVMTLYRPFLFQMLGNQPTAIHDQISQDWLASVERKATAAAMNTTNVLGNMVTGDMIRLCQSLVCITLVPTLQVHLLHSVSPRRLVRQLANHHLDLCMMVVEEIKVTYFGAEILHRLFARAREIIEPRHPRPGSTTPSGTDPGNVSVSGDTEGQGGHAVRSASPTIFINTAGSYGRDTYSSGEYEDADVNAILSQCMFPDFAAHIRID